MPPGADNQGNNRYKTVVESRSADAAGSPSPGSRSEYPQGERLQTPVKCARFALLLGGFGISLKRVYSSRETFLPEAVTEGTPVKRYLPIFLLVSSLGMAPATWAAKVSQAYRAPVLPNSELFGLREGNMAFLFRHMDRFDPAGGRNVDLVVYGCGMRFLPPVGAGEVAGVDCAGHLHAAGALDSVERPLVAVSTFLPLTGPKFEPPFDPTGVIVVVVLVVMFFLAIILRVMYKNSVIRPGINTCPNCKKKVSERARDCP